MTAPFDTVVATADVMRGFAHPWWVAGGWAIDLFVGRVTREHGDIEIGAFRDTQAVLHAQLRRFKLFKAVDGAFVPWAEGDEIRPPIFQIQASDQSLPGGELQVFLDDQVDGRWICRRNPALTRPIEEITLDSGVGGVKFLCPEIQLFFKAKHSQLAKNQQDFALVAPLLTPPQRLWARNAIAATHPDHVWLKFL